MSIKIIGAGFPRTGTMTLKYALQQLGYNKTYHYKDLIAAPEKLVYWQELETKGSTDFSRLFEGVEATVDFPGYPYYRILFEKYPDAKVLLSYRDFEKWYESTRQTIWKSSQKPVWARAKIFLKRIFNPKFRVVHRCIRFMRKTYLKKQFDGQFENKQKAATAFFQHIEEVKSVVPPSQLLVYDVGEGWEPLCRFLDKPVPDVPFPHLNKKENFHTMVKQMIQAQT